MENQNLNQENRENQNQENQTNNQDPKPNKRPTGNDSLT